MLWAVPWGMHVYWTVYMYVSVCNGCHTPPTVRGASLILGHLWLPFLMGHEECSGAYSPGPWHSWRHKKRVTWHISMTVIVSALQLLSRWQKSGCFLCHCSLKPCVQQIPGSREKGRMFLEGFVVVAHSYGVSGLVVSSIFDGIVHKI